jgi:DNA-binding beta-propeller fold protein YncE
MSVAIDYTSGAFAATKAQSVGTITGSDVDLSSGQYFEYTPAADTTFTFSNAPASGTAAGFALAVTGAEAASGYDLANASYDSVSFSVAGQETVPVGLFFKPDGLKMYVSGPVSDIVFQYSLSTAFDISTASYDSVSFSVSSQDASTAGLFFKPDGTKMYVVGYTGDSVYQYSLSSAWDLSTASYDNVSYSVASQANTPFGIWFKPDGTKMFVTDNGSDAVKEYSLSTAWNISTSSYQASFSVSSQEPAPYGLEFNPDGTKMYIVGINNDAVNEYDLSTAWDISTASYNSVSFSVASQSGTPTSIRFRNDGQKLYVSDSGTDTIYQYSTGTSAPVTFTYPTSVDWAGGTAPDAPAVGETDVLVFYTEDGGTTYYGFQAGDAMA